MQYYALFDMLMEEIRPDTTTEWLALADIAGLCWDVVRYRVWKGSNLGSHKCKAVRRLIRAAGAKLIFLPKYSPDLNPIEQVFAKLKHLLRKIAARTVDDVCAAIGQILGAFAPHECANYFRNSGYALT
jgi:hypothetical protein